jgi:putative membrane protein insertion efficiency factor
VRLVDVGSAVGRQVAGALRAGVRGYQLFLGPILPRSCRFHPSCSAYALEALRTHGALGGSWLTLRRLVRCHPWGGGGFDPVPQPQHQPQHQPPTRA